MAHRGTRLPAVLLVALAAVSCGAPTTVDSVLDRAEAALGGPEALDGIRSARFTSHGTWASPALGIPPSPYEIELVLQLPDRFRQEIRLESGEKLVVGFDGTESWGRWGAPPARFRGWMHDAIAEGMAELRALLVRPVRLEEPSSFKLLTPSPEGDPPVFRLAFTPPVGGAWELHVDEATGHLVGIEHEMRFMMDGEPMRGRWIRSEPTAFGPIVYPAVARFEGRRGDELLEVLEDVTDGIEWNPELPEGTFSRPPLDVDPAALGTKAVPSMTVITRRHTGPYDTLGASIEALMAAIPRGKGVVPLGQVYGTYLDDPGEVPPAELRTDLSAPVAVLGEPPELPPGLAYEKWPETTVAYAYHLGDYAEEGEAHERLFAWMKSERLRPDGFARVIWYHDPRTVLQDDLLSEVQVPVRRR